MYTDPKRVRADIPGTVEGNPVFIYHDAFNPDIAEVDDLKARYRAGKVGDVEVKTKLAKALNAYLEPMRARRADVLAKPATLRDILHEGSRKARAIAEATMERVRGAVKLRLRHGARVGAERRGREHAGGSGEARVIWNTLEFESILEAYPVRLQNFEGPLDLLLHLIKQQRGQHLRHPDRARSRRSTSTTST